MKRIGEGLKSRQTEGGSGEKRAKKQIAGGLQSRRFELDATGIDVGVLFGDFSPSPRDGQPLLFGLDQTNTLRGQHSNHHLSDSGECMTGLGNRENRGRLRLGNIGCRRQCIHLAFTLSAENIQRASIDGKYFEQFGGISIRVCIATITLKEAHAKINDSIGNDLIFMRGSDILNRSTSYAVIG